MIDRPSAERLSRAFFARDSVTVARALLGQRLVRTVPAVAPLDAGGPPGRVWLGGFICETEAYGGPDDPASHAFRRTERSAIMFGPPGFAYVYIIYGVHYCLNAVTGPDGVAGAVLVRALIPGKTLPEMRQRRGLPAEAGAHPARGVADGPGKLCQALGITLAENGLDLVNGEELYIEAGGEVAGDAIVATPRVGVRGTPEARSRPWRFCWSPGQ